MTMQSKKLSTLIAAASFGMCTMLPMSVMGQTPPQAGDSLNSAGTDEASSTVTFHSVIDPICSVDSTGADIDLPYDATPDGDGHVSEMSKDATVSFDCNTSTVDLDVVLDLLTPAASDASHQAYVGVTPAGASETALFGTGTEDDGGVTGLGTESDGPNATVGGAMKLVAGDGTTTTTAGTGGATTVSGAAQSTGDNGDIDVKVGSYFHSGSNAELLSGIYKAEFTITITAL